jgi:ferric-dicitrate binding protein FerR (iron transport regulator)
MSFIPEHSIIAFLQHTIGKEEEKALNEWLCEDKQNKELFFQFVKIWDFNQLISAEEHLAKMDRLARQLENQPQTSTNIPKQTGKPYITAWLRYAAAAAILVGITTSVWYAVHRNPEAPEISNDIVYCQLYNQDEEVQQCLLPDSSIVWLHSGGKLSYPATFNQEQMRRITLEGTAYFTVRKNTAQPFIVTTGQVDVTVTGTEFVVNAAQDANIVVTLISGGVKVDARKESGEKETFRLTPGQQADIDSKGAISVEKVETKYYQAWKDGTYIYVNEKLSEIVKQLAFHYQVDIQIAPALKNNRFTGKISPKHSLEDVLKIISTNHKMNYRITSEGIYIREK